MVGVLSVFLLLPQERGTLKKTAPEFLLGGRTRKPKSGLWSVQSGDEKRELVGWLQSQTRMILGN